MHVLILLTSPSSPFISKQNPAQEENSALQSHIIIYVQKYSCYNVLFYYLYMQSHTTCDPLPSWPPNDKDADNPTGSSSSLHLSESTKEEVSRTYFQTYQDRLRYIVVVRQMLLKDLVYGHTNGSVHSNYEASTIENLCSLYVARNHLIFNFPFLIELHIDGNGTCLWLYTQME